MGPLVDVQVYRSFDLPLPDRAQSVETRDNWYYVKFGRWAALHLALSHGLRQLCHMYCYTRRVLSDGARLVWALQSARAPGFLCISTLAPP